MGSSSGGRDWRGHRAGRAAAADRGEVRVYRKEFAHFGNLRTFAQAGGQKGVQRPVLPPGSLVPIHPVGFLVVTRTRVYGLPVSPELRTKMGRGGELTAATLGLKPDQLTLVRIEPQPHSKDSAVVDMVGIVTTYEGDPLPSGDIATRLGGYADVAQLEKGNASDEVVIEALLGRPAQQLPGLSGVPRPRRAHRFAA